ncbi:MAG: hypothetical protein EI684_00840 [Candidatus Viridilinea halotolerans]|uniref:Uncharacterized protein n=1 Tax=Candidatus Viridilinea halotolerans TaxID=2491704 RepID=A0A426UBU0_9CHLR|nr:MAG: hypothetical protein EI684_00840 [Candidatus Viridilinea halotolerans]
MATPQGTDADGAHADKPAGDHERAEQMQPAIYARYQLRRSSWVLRPKRPSPMQQPARASARERGLQRGAHPSAQAAGFPRRKAGIL